MEALLVLALVSFALHLAWERTHIVLYTGYEKLQGKLPIFVWASLGDVMYTFLAIALIFFFKESFLWFIAADAADYFGLAILGFCIAVFVEYKAMTLKHWEYAARMPRLWGLGLTPLMQMTVLLPLSVFITMNIMRILA